jgi:DNA-directed RNA polymerase specialized sigma24 family protein
VEAPVAASRAATSTACWDRDRTDEFANVDNQDAIDRALRALTPRQRAAIVLTEVLGYSSPDAAKIMGIRDVSVRALASQGRGTLRRILETDDE